MKKLSPKEWEILDDDFEYQGKSPKQVQDSEDIIIICFWAFVVLSIICLIIKLA